MCKNWREKGNCKYGDKCLFAHGTNELTKRSTANGPEPAKPATDSKLAPVEDKKSTEVAQKAETKPKEDSSVKLLTDNAKQEAASSLELAASKDMAPFKASDKPDSPSEIVTPAFSSQ